MSTRTSLARTPSAFTPEQLTVRQGTYERDLWHKHGVVVIRPEAIANDWLRRAVINHAEASWGKRGK